VEGSVDHEDQDDVNVVCIIMEKGRESLERAHLTAEQYIQCAETIVDALIYLHKQNIMHRDIKPANIMMRDDGSFMFVDFGFAKEIGEFQVMNSRILT